MILVEYYFENHEKFLKFTFHGLCLTRSTYCAMRIETCVVRIVICAARKIFTTPILTRNAHARGARMMALPSQPGIFPEKICSLNISAI